MMIECGIKYLLLLINLSSILKRVSWFDFTASYLMAVFS